MKHVLDEYGSTILAAVATICVLALVGLIVLRPGGVVSSGIEKMTGGYLSDRLPESEAQMRLVASSEPLEIRVVHGAVAGKQVSPKELFCDANGAPLRQVQVLGDGEGAWKNTADGILFPCSGFYAMRVYGEDAAGNYGCSVVWMNVAKEVA